MLPRGLWPQQESMSRLLTSLESVQHIGLLRVFLFVSARVVHSISNLRFLLVWEVTMTIIISVAAASSSGTRLHRGYVEEASPEDRPPQTTHVVFVVHGIGQKMDQGRIIKNTGMWVVCFITVTVIWHALQSLLLAAFSFVKSQVEL